MWGAGREMNVLSLFDGMACGLVALKRAGIKVENYYASEIDKWAIQIAMKNHPEIIQLGSVEDSESWELSKIDLIIGGSPCQGFSTAGKRLNWGDPRSLLFFKAIELIWDLKPKNFLLENVAKMKKEIKLELDELLGTESKKVNSSLLSAQNRERLYWSNICFSYPADKGIVLKDIIDLNNGDVSQKINLKTITDKSRKRILGNIREPDQKSNTLTALNSRCPGANGCTVIEFSDIKSGARRGRGDEIRSDQKANALLSGGHQSRWLAINGELFRKLTPIECERLQTLPDNYTEGVSNTQRYKMIGNGWTVDVIKHIFQALT